MQQAIKDSIARINHLSTSKPIKVISHNDTDGITAASIFSRALQRANKKFSLEITKGLTQEFIENLPESHILIFLDLASGSLDYLSKKQTEVFILDHHEIVQEIPSNVAMINPMLAGEENICSAAICYLFAKELDKNNSDLATLAVIGMVGDMHETQLNKVYSDILKDAEVTVRKGLLLYPATRPLDRVLESSFGIYIPGVTGSFKGTLELLRDANIDKTPKGFKSLAELTEEEMQKLITGIMLRKVGEPANNEEKMVGNMYLVRFFNHMEDARELSALINACSRMDSPETSLGLCLGNKIIKKEAQRVYTKYRKSISSALGELEEMEKIKGNNYIITNAKDKLKDTIVGTVTSIMSFSPLYQEGTILITMAYNTEGNIKVSARIAGRKGRNVREILSKAVSEIEGCEVGGHPMAAGCIIPKPKEDEFIKNLKTSLDIEMIRV